MWAGVDVGGSRKGFHAAVVDRAGAVRAVERCATTNAVVDLVRTHGARVVAVDSPVSAAPPGEASRAGERELAMRVCGIRYTPDRAAMTARDDSYYEWIEHGFELYEALRSAGVRTIECFPTASWTRWGGRRDRESRAAWSARVLAQLRLIELPARLGQDERDAIGAAATARAYELGDMETFGEIVVPVTPSGNQWRDRS